jgi:hypothetical protein
MLTPTAIASLKSFIRDSVAFAKYKVGSTYYQTGIRSAYIMDDGRVAITFLIDHTIPGTITVTEVQLYDRNGVLWATKAESITRKDLQEGILYRFAFTITES